MGTFTLGRNVVTSLHRLVRRVKAEVIAAHDTCASLERMIDIFYKYACICLQGRHLYLMLY